MKMTQLELTVLAVTLKDSLQAPDPTGKVYAFGQAARVTVWRDIITKLKGSNIELDIQQ